jgi:hypothetical protein
VDCREFTPKKRPNDRGTTPFIREGEVTIAVEGDDNGLLVTTGLLSRRTERRIDRGTSVGRVATK